MDYSLPGSSVHGISQARIREWSYYFLFQGIFPTQGSDSHLLYWQVSSLPLAAPGKPQIPHTCVNIWYLFFSFWLTSLCVTDSRSIYISGNDPVQMTHISFLFMAEYWVIFHCGLPRWLSSKESACQCRSHGFDLWVGKISWRRKWQPTAVFLPGKSHRQRSLAGYSPWGCKESDRT